LSYIHEISQHIQDQAGGSEAGGKKACTVSFISSMVDFQQLLSQSKADS
ncbi:MAG: hypothetical protein F6K47_43835, partial [Symploca sp. SIO2E6]|nr:hypothetical protein [Symploca sp. SIO2E6]